jgi:hypothetical protein
VDTHCHTIQLRARLDNFKVDLRHLSAEFDQVDGSDLVDANNTVWITQTEVSYGAVRMAAQIRPSVRLGKRHNIAHFHASRDRVQIISRRQRDLAVADVGRDSL